MKFILIIIQSIHIFFTIQPYNQKHTSLQRDYYYRDEISNDHLFTYGYITCYDFCYYAVFFQNFVDDAVVTEVKLLDWIVLHLCEY